MASTTSGNPVVQDNGTVANTARALFAGQQPVNGFSVLNPDANNDCWINENGTAVANGAGSIRIPANGGGYESPAHHAYKPNGPISIIGGAGSTPVNYTARSW